MSKILELQVTTCQALKVSKDCVTISYMNDAISNFSARLNLALDHFGVPVKGKGRQNAVAEMFKVSQKGARKWLEREGMPKTERIVEMSQRLGVRAEWLLTGEGEMMLRSDLPATPVRTTTTRGKAIPPHESLKPPHPSVASESDWAVLSPSVRTLIESIIRTGSDGTLSDPQAAALNLVVWSNVEGARK